MKSSLSSYCAARICSAALFLLIIVLVCRPVTGFAKTNHPLLRHQLQVIDVSKDLTRLNIASSNMLPGDPSADCGPLLEAAAKYAAKNNIQTVSVPAGDYYFRSVRNKAFVWLNGVSNVAITGHQSNFLFASRQFSGIIIANSKNTGLSDITLDYAADLPFTSAKVTSVNAAQNTINIATPSGRPVTDFNNSGKNSIRVFVLRKTNYAAWSRLPIQRLAVVNGGLSNQALVVTGSPAVSSDILRRDLAQIRPGDILSISERSYSGVNALAFVSYPPVISSGNYAKNVTIYSSPSLGVTSLWQNSVILSGVKVIPKPGREQYISSNADGINATNSGAGSKITGCTIIGSGDDGISVASNLLGMVTALNGDNSYNVALRYQLTQGQSISLSNPGSLTEYGSGKITGIQELAERSGEYKQFKITLDAPLQQAQKGAYIFIPKENRSPGLLLQDNIIQMVNARGIYLAGVTGVQVIGNTIEKTNSSGIIVQQLAESGNGYKTPGNTNIIITGNKIHQPFAWGSANARGAIESSVQGSNGDTETVNNGLSIADNEIVLAPGSNSDHVGIFISHTKGSRLRNNKMNAGNGAAALPSAKAVVLGEKNLDTQQ